MNSVVTGLLLLLCCCCVALVNADMLSLPSIDSLAAQGTSTYMEHHSNMPQLDRQYDTGPTGTHSAMYIYVPYLRFSSISGGLISGYSSGGYDHHSPVDPPGYAIQEGYEGFLIPMKTGVVTGLTIALTIVSVLLGLLSFKVFKLPVLALLLPKLKKLIKLNLIRNKFKKKPVGRQLIDDDHIVDLTSLIYSAIDRLDQFNRQQTTA